MVRSLEIVVTTYNRPEYTALVLESYLHQSDRDFSLAIADDGSGPAIAELVAQYRSRGLNVRHVWHEDRGFRRAEILNKAIATSSADYLVFTDNDCMAQREFVADHKHAAQPGHFVVGRRVNLNSTLSERFVEGSYGIGRINGRMWLLGMRLCGHLEYAEMGLRIPVWLSDRISRKGGHLLGANTGVWRADLLRVNGYDNDFVGYGSEDVDLEWRLRAVGLESRSLKGRGCVVHLYHEQRRGTPRNVELLNLRQQSNLFRVRNGVVDERAQ